MKKEQTKSGAKDVFSYLLMVGTLLASVVSFLVLATNYINLTFPDVSDWMIGQQEAVRGAIATLVIVWPVTLLMNWLINKDLRKNTEKARMWIRKWLLHLLLFLAAITIVVDLITLVGTFLNGELTIRFALKVAVVLLTAVVVFWHQFWEIKRDPKQKTFRPLAVGLSVSVVAVVAIVLGFLAIDSPAQQRAIKVDRERVEHLTQIQGAVLDYLDEEQSLPASLEEIDWRPGTEEPLDPETNGRYWYEVLSEKEFQLCTTFNEPTQEDFFYHTAIPVFDENGEKIDDSFYDWSHEAGEYCFVRNVPDSWFDVDEEETQE